MTSRSFQTVRRMREAWKCETDVPSQSFSPKSAVKYLHVGRRKIQISPLLGEQDQSNSLPQGQQRQAFLGRATWSEDAFSEAPSATFLTTVFMEVSSVFVTPKRKYSRNSSCSSTEASPEEKRAKEASSPDGEIKTGKKRR